MSENSLLRMQDISKQFNGVVVLDHVNLEVKAGEVHVLIGENGAGKSTLMKILSGAYRMETGDILLDGEKIEITGPRDALNRGISIIYQEFNLVPYLSVYENIYLGREFSRSGVLDKKKAIEEASKSLELIGVTLDPRTVVEKLSVAEQQMVEIAKALTQDVRLLVLDEPTASLTDKETDKLFELIRRLKEQGIGIIYISHRMKELFTIGDRCTVMRDGRSIKTLNLEETDIDELTYLMVGHRVEQGRMLNPARTQERLMEVKDISWRRPGTSKDFLQAISFDLKKGELLGFSGLVGAGRTELAKCLIGAYRRSGGRILLAGEEIQNRTVTESINNGIVYLSEDRKGEGLVLMHSVAENILLPNLKRVGNWIVQRKKAREFVETGIQELKVKVRDAAQAADTLSGGNQQKVVIAKWLPSDAKVYIFDEPTRGIDVGAREEIYRIMLRILQNGSSIIMISSDMNELMKMSDRIAVMKDGELITILDNTDDLTPEQVLGYGIMGKAGRGA